MVVLKAVAAVVKTSFAPWYLRSNPIVGDYPVLDTVSRVPLDSASTGRSCNPPRRPRNAGSIAWPLLVFFAFFQACIIGGWAYFPIAVISKARAAFADLSESIVIGQRARDFDEALVDGHVRPFLIGKAIQRDARMVFAPRLERGIAESHRFRDIENFARFIGIPINHAKVNANIRRRTVSLIVEIESYAELVRFVTRDLDVRESEMGTLRRGEGFTSQPIRIPRLIAIEGHSEESENVNPKGKVFKLIFYGLVAVSLTGAGVYQFKFKLADETTLQGVLIRIGFGAGLIVVGQSFFVLFLVLVD
jgi:hypothetical protein